MGSACRTKVRRAALRSDLSGFKAHQWSSAAELIEDKGMQPLRGRRVWAAVSKDGTRVHRVAANACTCEAGIYGRPCYHRLATVLLTES